MGLLGALLGNASEVNASKLEKEFATLLIEGEKIQHAYKLFRDLIVFTNYRLFLVDKQGMTGKLSTLPHYSSTSLDKASPRVVPRHRTVFCLPVCPWRI
jgi:hypothetical protein